MENKCWICGKDIKPGRGIRKRIAGKTCSKKCRKIRKTERQWKRRAEKREKALTPVKEQGRVKTLTDLRDRTAPKECKVKKAAAPKRVLGAVVVW